MQKLRILPLAALSLSVGLMSACDSTSSNSSPTITNLYLGDGTATVTLTAGQGSTGIHATVSGSAGFTVTFTVMDANGSDVTTNFTPSFTQPGSSATSWSAFNDGNASLTAKSTAANGTYTLILTAANGGASSVAKTSFNVTGGTNGGGGGSLTEYTNGMIYNRFGTGIGAWSLTGDTAVPASSSDPKDLRDALTSATTGVFDGSLTSPDGAMFVQSNLFNYSSATTQSIQSAYAAGTPSASIDAPSVGDIYLIKLASGNYAVLKVTAIVPGSTTVGVNTGSISFTYKM
ncbi:MAG TPA: hypothetical protein VN931_06985 [Fibrobacteria bacterium]|nr:hypothetical protein [Fibrobacteria bacterium]